MLSIEPRSVVALSCRRAEIASFWCLATMSVSVLAAGTALALGSTTPWRWSAAGTLLLVPAAFWSPWFETGIKAWNRWARLLTMALRAYALYVCYYTVVAAAGRWGAAHDASQPGTSGWRTRRPVDVGLAYEGRRALTQDGWYQGLLACTRSAASAWVIGLLPLVLLLRLLRDEQPEGAPTGSSYTLY